MSDDHDVGYGKPPKSGQFKKGKSGNPKGRMRGSKNYSTMVADALRQPVVINENGKRKTITMAEAGFKQQAAKLAGGDGKALKLMIDIAALVEAREEARARGGDISNEDRRVLDEQILASIRDRMADGGDYDL